MDNLQNEQDFSRIVREHKSTIYTVCYMFSKNEDEVNDLFQEVLINLWKGLQNFEEKAMCARGSIVSASTPASLVTERNGNGKRFHLR